MTTTQIAPPPTQQASPQRVGGGILDPRSLITSLPMAVRKLDPRDLWRNPIMLIVEIGAVWTTVLALRDPSFFAFAIAVWLWLTVVFGTLTEAVAEGRGKAQAATLRAAKRDTVARRLRSWSPGATGPVEEPCGASELRPGDHVVVEAGQFVPGDGDVVEGIASIDESAITGESAPVIRESGGDRSAVTGGTRVLSDRIVVRITQEPGQSFIDRMIALVEGANRQKTPNEIALNILLAALTIIFLAATATMQPMAIYAKAQAPGVADSLALDGGGVTAIVLVSLVVCLIPTTIGALLSAIGIAGMDRLVQRNVLAMSGRAVEAAGDVGTLLLDKTGTITLGNRHATELLPLDVPHATLAEAAQLSSLIARSGGTPLVVAERRGGQEARVLGVLRLSDVVKPGMRERFDTMRAMGIRTVMITGDNPATAAAIAAGAGVDDFLAEATPEDKLALSKAEQEGGRLVAMTGDGTNDAPALAQADVGVAMNTGTSAAKEAGNMVDLDSDPTKLIEIVEIGKQLLITRGALTTFSIANDVAKYFAIIPAMFTAVYPGLDRLNVMGLASPQSAILSAVVFNAIVIVALIPLVQFLPGMSR